jgi:hypothetical protein
MSGFEGGRWGGNPASKLFDLAGGALDMVDQSINQSINETKENTKLSEMEADYLVLLLN